MRRPPLLRHRGRTAEPNDRVLRAYEEHRRVLDAIEDRDPEMAELQMRRHVASARVRQGRAMLTAGKR